MEYNIYILFLIFFIYSVIGYIVESTYTSIVRKQVTFSRGFLIGPYLPIFGFGGLFLTVYLKKYSNDLIALFVMSAASCMILEYFSSYILEKIFKLRWWDYSKLSFNINGRVCLKIGLMFGIAGIIAIKLINPYINRLLTIMSNNVQIIVAILLFIILIIDLYISGRVVVKFGHNFARYSKDSTYELKEKIIEELNKDSFIVKRLLKSFPTAKDKLNKFRELRTQYYKKID